MKCYACGKLVWFSHLFVKPFAGLRLTFDNQGHISRDCTAPNGGPLSSTGKVCYKCSQAGHISRDCPTNEANAQQVTDPSAAATVAPAVDGTAEVPAVAAPAPTSAVA